MPYEFRPVMMRLRVDLPSEAVAKKVFAKLDDDDFFYKIDLRFASIIDYDRKGIALFFECRPKKNVVEAAQREIGDLLDKLMASIAMIEAVPVDATPAVAQQTDPATP
jgi:hypothetical protein